MKHVAKIDLKGIIRTLGYLNQTEAAEVCGISRSQLNHLTFRFKVLPGPTHQVGNYQHKFYTHAEVAELQKLFDRYRAERATTGDSPATDKA